MESESPVKSIELIASTFNFDINYSPTVGFPTLL
jgi:hypothetical protein